MRRCVCEVVEPGCSLDFRLCVEFDMVLLQQYLISMSHTEMKWVLIFFFKEMSEGFSSWKLFLDVIWVHYLEISYQHLCVCVCVQDRPCLRRGRRSRWRGRRWREETRQTWTGFWGRGPSTRMRKMGPNPQRWDLVLRGPYTYWMQLGRNGVIAFPMKDPFHSVQMTFTKTPPDDPISSTVAVVVKHSSGTDSLVPCLTKFLLCSLNTSCFQSSSTWYRASFYSL